MLRNNRTHARTCGDCRFMTERMGVLRTHCECLEPSQSGRRCGWQSPWARSYAAIPTSR